MRLTDQEHKMLKGDYGPGVAEAMKIVVALGEAYDAPQLVKVSRAHEAFGGGESSTWFLELLAEMGAKCCVPTTCNPIFDDEYLEKIGRPLSREDTDLCRRSRVARTKLGIIPTECCTPYLDGNVPRMGEVIAFSESSATPYVNSVCGARSHRESANSALASAVCGRTPLYGSLLDENRKGNILVNMDAALKDDFDYHLLGYAVGKEAGTGVPVFTGMQDLCPQPAELMSLGAELATSGAVSLYHIVGFTPEARTLEMAFDGRAAKKELTVTSGDLEKVRQANSQQKGPLDFVMLGCPHYNLWQVRDVAMLLEGRTIRKGVDFWVFTSPVTRDYARTLGYEKIINRAGGHIIARTCCDEICWERFYQGKMGATDSMKAAYYTSKLGIGFILERRGQCIEAAVKGGF